MSISRVRRAANLLSASALTIVGVFGTMFLLFYAGPASLWSLIGTGFPVVVGLIWLGADLVDAGSNEER
jgi:nitric oxide reductase large subunit